MMRLSSLVVLFASAVVCYAQGVALWEAKKDIGDAKEKVEQVVVFCPHCEASGKIEERECPHCQGHGAILKCEAELVEHRHHLKRRAERAGASAERYADFDAGGRLKRFEEKIEPQALEMLAAYVGYMKAYRKHKDLVKQDEEFAQKTEETARQLDKLIDRHARRLFIQSLRMLHGEDPVGNVGVFNPYGRKTQVRVDGKDMECLKMRTLKGYSILIIKSAATKRKGFILAEIVGKGTYKTDDGRTIPAIMLQPW